MTDAVPPRGLFIVFEGPDRAGKTTQWNALFGALCARPDVKATPFRFPNYAGVVGDQLQKYNRRALDVDARTAHLMFAANRADMIPGLQRTLEAGFTVICDRYVYSGCAYSVAKGLDYDWCVGIERDLPRPDLVIELDAEPEQLAARAEFGSERHDDVAFLERVRGAYLRLKYTHHRWMVLEATLPQEQIAALILTRVSRMLDEQREPLKQIVEL